MAIQANSWHFFQKNGANKTLKNHSPKLTEAAICMASMLAMGVMIAQVGLWFFALSGLCLPVMLAFCLSAK
jgi:hypothetical protein